MEEVSIVWVSLHVLLRQQRIDSALNERRFWSEVGEQLPCNPCYKVAEQHLSLALHHAHYSRVHLEPPIDLNNLLCLLYALLKRNTIAILHACWKGSRECGARRYLVVDS